MNAKKLAKLDHLTLAEGEVTGHAHRADGDRVTLWADGDGAMVLRAPRGAIVTHEEHGPLTLPAGSYSRRIVKEYDHFAEEVRDVAD